MNSGINSPLRGNLRKLLREPQTNPFPEIIGTFMGRDAFSLAASSLGLNTEDTVLLPAYLCREVLKPFLGKTRVVFYDLPRDLAVDPDQIRLKLGKTKMKVVLIINYFGFLQPHRKEIKKLCADQGIILMEDCAHSLLTEGSGETGDVSIYSFRKLLPVPDGGGLKMSIGKKKVAPKFYPRTYSNFLSVLIILKSLFGIRAEMLSRAGLTSRGKTLFPNATAPARNRRILPLSSFTYNGVGNASFSEIIEKRRSDYHFWQEVAARTNLFLPVFSDLPEGVCPIGFPVRAKDRDQLRLRLQEMGGFPEIHWHLPEAVGREFNNSHELSAQTLTLPIYPRLGRIEREGIPGMLLS
jgi:perosamine synthetase